MRLADFQPSGYASWPMSRGWQLNATLARGHASWKWCFAIRTRDISVGTTAAEDRTCAGPIEAALAAILGPTPERVALTVRTVSQDEVDVNFDTYERLLAQKIGATAPIQSVGRMPPKLAKSGRPRGRVFTGHRQVGDGVEKGVNRGSRSAATRIVDRSDREPRVGGL
jgi:copper chaperone CopZ